MRYFFSALAAGIAVALGSYAYVACESRYLGAFLFSFGMLIVCVFQLPLYTGRICYAGKGGSSSRQFLSMLPANILGAVLVGVLSYPVKGGANVMTVAQEKLAQPMLQSFLLAVLCGGVIFFIVHTYRNSPDPVGRYLGILLGVPVFVISRMENSIPDVFYVTAALRQYGYFEWRALLFLPVVLIGNGVGGWLLHCLMPRDS